MDHWLQHTLSRLEAKRLVVVDVREPQENDETTPSEPTSAPSDREKQKAAKTLTPYFPMAFLVVVITFTILATLDVNIAPLLAGAGVIGLAIGFGSQTFVKDIIAGIFFLIDDAFRVGDYVEPGTAKGTVEAISLRSLRLRYPHGQVFVVPCSAPRVLMTEHDDRASFESPILVKFFKRAGAT